jgi:DnaK suppressor protein
MQALRERLLSELERVLGRLGRPGLTVADLPRAVGEDTALGEEVDVGRVSEDREMSFATRSLLVARARRLAQALERLEAGTYGRCRECDAPIAPRRLEAMPEVTTCVRCQERLEREETAAGVAA